MIAAALYIVAGVLFALTQLARTEVADSGLLAWGLVSLAAAHLASILEGRKR